MKSPPTERLHHPIPTRARTTRGLLTTTCAVLIGAVAVFCAPCAIADPPEGSLQAPQDPSLLLANLTLDLYRVVLEHPASCADLTAAIEQFLDAREPDFIAAVAALKARLDDGEDIAYIAATIQEIITGHPLVLEGQAVIYACVKAKETQGKKRSLTKQMQRLHAYHEALLLELLGPLD